MGYIDDLYKKRENLSSKNYDKDVNYICETIVEEVKKRVEWFILYGDKDRDSFEGAINYIGFWDNMTTPYAISKPFSDKNRRKKVSLPVQYIQKLENKVKEEIKKFELHYFEINCHRPLFEKQTGENEYYITFKMTQVRRKNR